MTEVLTEGWLFEVIFGHQRNGRLKDHPNAWTKSVNLIMASSAPINLVNVARVAYAEEQDESSSDEGWAPENVKLLQVRMVYQVRLESQLG